MSVNGFLVNNTVQKYNYESLENYNTPDFSTSSTYQVGDYVMYQGKLYKCTTEITTSGGWDSSEWSLAILSDDVANLRSSVESGEYGLSEPVKQAILQIARKVAYVDAQGQTYYDDLYDALYPLQVVSISAVYTQTGTVYDTDTLDSLKTDLVVTANYSDSSTQIVPSADYTLSGTLTVGTSTITVSYGGKTTTFSVTVSETPDTSPVITDYGVSFNIDGTTSARNAWAITDFYSMNYPGSLPYTLVIDFGGYNPAAYLIVYNENKEKTNNYECNTRVRELVWRTVAPPAFFRTSVYDIRKAAYAYVKETGVVIFADVNSPYYGMHNISEASS